MAGIFALCWQVDQIQEAFSSGEEAQIETLLYKKDGKYRLGWDRAVDGLNETEFSEVNKE